MWYYTFIKIFCCIFSSNLTHSDSIGSNNSTPELPKRPPPLAPLTRSINSAFEAYEKPLSPKVKRDKNSPNVMSPLSPRIRSNSNSDPRIRKNSSGSRVRIDIYWYSCLYMFYRLLFFITFLVNINFFQIHVLIILFICFNTTS